MFSFVSSVFIKLTYTGLTYFIIYKLRLLVVVCNIFFCYILAASVWVNTTCRDIQTAIIKTCAYTNRFALKCAFGKEYNELYPGTIYSPPSYNDHFSSTEG